MSNRLGYFAGAAALAFFVGVPLAYGHVLDPDVSDADKARAKLRTDIGKQGSKHVACLVKATTKCEEEGGSTAVQCHLATGIVDFAPGSKTEEKFQEAIAKCDEKYAPTKKGTDYVGIGCPGDCNQGAAGVQQCANISPAYEALIESTTVATSAKVQLPVLAAAIDLACAVDTGAAQTDPARIACVTQNAATLGVYGQKLFKCVRKCETDFKDKKGNGGGTNGPNCLSNDAGSDANFDLCDGEALTKAVEKEGALSATNTSVVLPAVRTAVNNATTGLFNRFDPTGDVFSNPCGNCGNGIREGAEECDLADDVLCGGPCNADCTCP